MSQSLWPGSSKFALALSHDVDRIAKRAQFPYYFLRAICTRRLDQVIAQMRSFVACVQGDDPYWNFERIMDLEDKLGVRSTFFFLSETGNPRLDDPKSFVLFWGRYAVTDARVGQIIRRLDDCGWEIGLHGSFHSYRDEALLRQEKGQLEAILGKPVAGIRQHYLNLDIPRTWHAQARAGLLYDSSLGFADRIGFRWGMFHPFFPQDPQTGQEIPVLQIPLTIMDAPLMQMPDPWEAARSLITTVEKEQGVLTILWHQRFFNPWEPASCQELYGRIIQECQERDAWVTTLGDIAKWWTRTCLGC